MEWIVIPVVTVLGMMGGQKIKALRRYGIPTLSLVIGKKGKKRDKFLLLLALFLSMGYGENSKLYELCGGKWWLVRLVYGVMVGVPVVLAGYVWGALIMPLAYMVRFNYSFKVGKYDFLWQDFYTYSLLGYCIWMVV